MAVEVQQEIENLQRKIKSLSDLVHAHSIEKELWRQQCQHIMDELIAAKFSILTKEKSNE